jgi:hypothetical protein
MGKKATSLIPMHEINDPPSTDIVKRQLTEEERVFMQFCDCVDGHLRWKGLPPIASDEAERREKAMIYMLKSIEAFSWFSELVGGLGYLNDLLGKRRERMEVTDGSHESEKVVKKKSRFVAKVRR